MEYFAITLVVFLCHMGESLFAAQWDIPTQGIQEFQVRAKAARVEVKKASGPFLRIKVSGAKESAWQQEVQGEVIRLIGPEEDGGIEESVVSLEIPPSINNSYLSFEAVQAELQGVSKLMINALKGKIIGRATGEGMRYSLQKGDIQSYQSMGDLEIESFGAKMMVSEFQGALKVQLFSGSLQIDKSQGSLQLASFSSQGKILSYQGNMTLQWAKGPLSLNEFSGRLSGIMNDGQLVVHLKPEGLMDLQALRGKVTVHLPADSGAQVNVRSLSGEVIVPGPLKSNREGRYRVARGKLAGTIKGNVVIRGEEASIGIR